MMRDRVVLGMVALLLAPTLAQAQAQQRSFPFPRVVFVAPEVAGDGVADRWHYLIGENAMLTDAWLSRHTRRASGGQFGLNAVIADLWYDAAMRRTVTRSLQLGEVDDPPDLRLGRAPGTYPNVVDYRATLSPGTVTGIIGWSGWLGDGFTAYQAALWGVVLDPRRQVLCLGNAPGVAGKYRKGGSYSHEELVCHVAILPDGTVVLGYDTDPSTPVRVVVRGDLLVEGRVVEGARVE